MDIRHYNLTIEIAHLESALADGRRALWAEPDPHRRQAGRLDLAAGYEHLGALYRRLHGLGAEGGSADGVLICVVAAAAHACS